MLADRKIHSAYGLLIGGVRQKRYRYTLPIRKPFHFGSYRCCPLVIEQQVFHRLIIVLFPCGRLLQQLIRPPRHTKQMHKLIKSL